MRILAALLYCSIALAQAPVPEAVSPDAKAIVVKSLAVDNRNQELLNQYTYKMLQVEHQSGKADKTKLFEFFSVVGEQFRLLTEVDGKPLTVAEAAKEHAKLDAAIEKAKGLSPEERQKHAAQHARNRAKNRDQRQYIPEAFQFPLLGEEEINGRKSWKIEARPTGTYKGPHADLLRNMAGILWIDQQDYEWTKVEAESLGTISFGLFLARLSKGARISFENQRVNGELWAPRRVAVKASLRLVLLAKTGEDLEITFKDYKKFQTDARIVSTEQ